VNILILGGLLLLGIAAIVVAVVLLLGEQRAEKARATSVTPSTPAASPVALEAPRPRPARTTQRLAASTPPVRQSVPTAPVRETPLQARADEQQHFALNGQFHELAAELRTLYQQASDLEQRLHTLSEIADRVEESQPSRLDFEEEAPSRFDNTAP